MVAHPNIVTLSLLLSQSLLFGRYGRQDAQDQKEQQQQQGIRSSNSNNSISNRSSNESDADDPEQQKQQLRINHAIENWVQQMWHLDAIKKKNETVAKNGEEQRTTPVTHVIHAATLPQNNNNNNNKNNNCTHHFIVPTVVAGARIAHSTKTMFGVALFEPGSKLYNFLARAWFAVLVLAVATIPSSIGSISYYFNISEPVMCLLPILHNIVLLLYIGVTNRDVALQCFGTFQFWISSVLLFFGYFWVTLQLQSIALSVLMASVGVIQCGFFWTLDATPFASTLRRRVVTVLVSFVFMGVVSYTPPAISMRPDTPEQVRGSSELDAVLFQGPYQGLIMITTVLLGFFTVDMWFRFHYAGGGGMLRCGVVEESITMTLRDPSPSPKTEGVTNKKHNNNKNKKRTSRFLPPPSPDNIEEQHGEPEAGADDEDDPVLLITITAVITEMKAFADAACRSHLEQLRRQCERANREMAATTTTTSTSRDPYVMWILVDPIFAPLPSYDHVAIIPSDAPRFIPNAVAPVMPVLPSVARAMTVRWVQITCFVLLLVSPSILSLLQYAADKTLAKSVFYGAHFIELIVGCLLFPTFRRGVCAEIATRCPEVWLLCLLWIASECARFAALSHRYEFTLVIVWCIGIPSILLRSCAVFFVDAAPMSRNARGFVWLCASLTFAVRACCHMSWVIIASGDGDIRSDYLSRVFEIPYFLYFNVGTVITISSLVMAAFCARNAHRVLVQKTIAMLRSKTVTLAAAGGNRGRGSGMGGSTSSTSMMNVLMMPAPFSNPSTPHQNHHHHHHHHHHDEHQHRSRSLRPLSALDLTTRISSGSSTTSSSGHSTNSSHSTAKKSAMMEVDRSGGAATTATSTTTPITHMGAVFDDDDDDD
eukprot:PhM_4_TR16122/c5_g1_i1/m.101352